MDEKISIKISEDIVRCLKEKHNKTVAEIAKLAGTTRKRISNIESGEDSFTVKHIIRMEEEIPIYVSLSEYIKENLIAEYNKKGQEVPKDLLDMHKVDMHEALLKCLRLSAELRKKARKK